MAANFTFGFNANSITINGNGNNIESNILQLGVDQYKIRFFADIIKDAKVPQQAKPYKPSAILHSIIPYLKSCYPADEPILNLFNTMAANDNQLEELKTHVDTILAGNIEKQLNLVKNSTSGQDARKITDATNIFWESGDNLKLVCRAPLNTIIKYGTPGSILDPLSKGYPNQWFPAKASAAGALLTITFDNTFTTRLGFPDNLEWNCTNNAAAGLFNVNINFRNNGGDVEIEDDISSIQNRRPPTERGDFSEYTKGNKDKNLDISQLDIPTDCVEFKKLVVSKELGDIAQVWMYFAFIIITAINQGGDINANITRIKSQSSMITTDSVVYLFCQLLGIACVYTGAREGVKSGQCSVYSFTTGNPNFSTQLKNMTRSYYERIFEHNKIIINGLTEMAKSLNFKYLRLVPHTNNFGNPIADTIELTRGYNLPRNCNPNMITEIKTFFTQLKEHYVQQQSQLVINFNSIQQDQYDAAVDAIYVTTHYTEYCDGMNGFKSPQIITILPDKTINLNPGDVLNRFIAIVNTQADSVGFTRYVVPPGTINYMINVIIGPPGPIDTDPINPDIDIASLDPITILMGPDEMEPDEIEPDEMGSQDDDNEDFAGGALTGRFPMNREQPKRYTKISKPQAIKTFNYTKNNNSINIFGYYECFLMCYIYKFFIKNITETNLILFSILYDTIISMLTNNITIFDIPLPYFNKENVDIFLINNDDDVILYAGNYLSRYLYFGSGLDIKTNLPYTEQKYINTMINVDILRHNNIRRSVNPQRFGPQHFGVGVITPRSRRLERIRIQAARARGITKKTHKHRRSRKQNKTFHKKTHKRRHIKTPLERLRAKLQPKTTRRRQRV
jgi:hypothetical protein